VHYLDATALRVTVIFNFGLIIDSLPIIRYHSSARAAPRLTERGASTDGSVHLVIEYSISYSASPAAPPVSDRCW
jgi:hypothetical protein